MHVAIASQVWISIIVHSSISVKQRTPVFNTVTFPISQYDVFYGPWKKLLCDHTCTRKPVAFISHVTHTVIAANCICTRSHNVTCMSTYVTFISIWKICIINISKDRMTVSTFYCYFLNACTQIKLKYYVKYIYFFIFLDSHDNNVVHYQAEQTMS